MSAIGAKQWYDNYKKALSETDLVLERYPLSFLQECAEKIGSPFYVTTSCGIIDEGQVIGSLLPFGRRSQPISTHNRTDIVHEHESVRTWKILSNGSVQITQAGIVASSKAPKSTPKIQALFLQATWPTVGEARYRTNLNDLVEKMASPETVVFAVCLCANAQKWEGSDGPKGHKGVILKQVSGYSSVKTYLVKVGIYICDDLLEMPKAEEVDWIVL
jgi:hypothetical protein